MTQSSCVRACVRVCVRVSGVCVCVRERKTLLCLVQDWLCHSFERCDSQKRNVLRKRDRPPVGHQRCIQILHNVNRILSCYWPSCAHSRRPLGQQNIAPSYVEQKVKPRRMLWDWDRWRWLRGGASSYNIIFIVCSMPIMDGWQVGISGETQKHKETERQHLYLS